MKRGCKMARAIWWGRSRDARAGVVADQTAVDGRLAGAAYAGPAGVRVEGDHGSSFAGIAVTDDEKRLAASQAIRLAGCSLWISVQPVLELHPCP